ncbi:MAG: hypothetical protein V4584_09955 [Verrucomicrobiota bacterium]
MLESVVLLLFEFLAEVLFQFVFELLAEMGLQWAGERYRGPANPWLSGFGYLCLGLAAGGISLLVLPSQLIHSPAGQIANLVVTPLVIGAAMARLGAWRSRRGQLVLRIDRFACGALFALAFALIRYWLAK